MMNTFDALGIDRPTEEACVNTIGLPLADCFVVAAGLSDAQGERCAEVYRRIFHDNNVPGSVPPFEGVVETIRTLHQQGHTLAVATSRRHESLDELLAEFGVTDLFSMIVAADDVTHANPTPSRSTRSWRRSNSSRKRPWSWATRPTTSSWDATPGQGPAPSPTAMGSARSSRLPGRTI